MVVTLLQHLIEALFCHISDTIKKMYIINSLTGLERCYSFMNNKKESRNESRNIYNL